LRLRPVRPTGWKRLCGELLLIIYITNRRFCQSKAKEGVVISMKGYTEHRQGCLCHHW